MIHTVGDLIKLLEGMPQHTDVMVGDVATQKYHKLLGVHVVVTMGLVAINVDTSRKTALDKVPEGEVRRAGESELVRTLTTMYDELNKSGVVGARASISADVLNRMISLAKREVRGT